MTLSYSTLLWLEGTTIVDHDDLGLARLIWQYRGDKPRLQGALEAWLDDIQSIEDVSLQVLSEVWPLTAVGVQLDNLGEIVRQARGELSDDEYRLFILGRILANRSNGTLPELLGILDVLGITDDVLAVEGSPACITLSVAGATYGDLIGALVDDAVAGGVCLHWLWSAQDVDNTFTLSESLGSGQTSGTKLGFGDLAGGQTHGGYLSGSTTREP